MAMSSREDRDEWGENMYGQPFPRVLLSKAAEKWVVARRVHGRNHGNLDTEEMINAIQKAERELL